MDEPATTANANAETRASSVGLPAALATHADDQRAGRAEQLVGERGQIGRFTVLKRLGEGGMGVVFTAYDDKLDRKVAIKLIRSLAHGEAARLRLLREAQGLARLSHPNVVQVYDTGVHARSIYVAMEYVSGRTLRAWIRSDDHDARPWRETLAVMMQAGRGLEAAHQAGLVHRDFKPENAILGRDGRVRVLDFGLVREHDAAGGRGLIDSNDLSRSVSGDDEDTLDTAGVDSPTALAELTPSSGPALEQSLTRTGAIMGTPAYMAPEQHLGLPCSALADQFSFCVALYEALYGARPFAGQTRDALRDQVLKRAPAPAPSNTPIPAAIHAAIRRGLAANPEDRWPDMGALLSALERGSVGEARRPWARRRLATALITVTAALAGAVALRARASGSSGSFVAAADFTLERQGRGGWYFLYDRDGAGRYEELAVAVNRWGFRTWVDARCDEATVHQDPGRPDELLLTAAWVNECHGWTTLAWEAPEPGAYRLELSATEYNHCESNGMDLELRAHDGALLWTQLDTDPGVVYEFDDTRSFARGERLYLRLAHGPGNSWCDTMAVDLALTRR